MQWLQYPKENDSENLNNVRRKAGRHFRTKRGDIETVKLMNLRQTGKNENIRE